jgi:DNA-binding transcriptional MerR regulator
MTIHEVEELLGLTKQALIYYEKEGLIQPSRDVNNYRNFTQKDIDTLQLIQLLRSMEITIDEIKLILAGDLSIRDALETKQEFINHTQIKLEHIDEKIKEYIKRKKVYVTNDEKSISSAYPTLYFHNDEMKFLNTVIHKNDIQQVRISMCCSKGENGMYYGIHNLYFVDLDIYTAKDTYSFQLMNNEKVNELFEWFIICDMKRDDPMNIIRIYHDYTDPIQLNNYINRHFRDWAKQYDLDNPRENYYDIIKKNDCDVFNEKKQHPITLKEQCQELQTEWQKCIRRLLKK